MKMTQKHSLALFRERTGLSQENLAGMLGLNRSAINMYERNLRDLPTAAILKLVALEKALDAPTAAPAAVSSAKQQEQLKRHADELHYAALVLEKKIANAERKQQQQQQLAILLNILASQQKPGAPKSSESLWLAMMQADQATVDTAAADSALQMDKLKHRMLLLEQEEVMRMMK